MFAKTAACKTLLWALGDNDDDRWFITAKPGPPVDARAKARELTVMHPQATTCPCCGGPRPPIRPARLTEETFAHCRVCGGEQRVLEHGRLRSARRAPAEQQRQP